MPNTEIVAKPAKPDCVAMVEALTVLTTQVDLLMGSDNLAHQWLGVALDDVVDAILAGREPDFATFAALMHDVNVKVD